MRIPRDLSGRAFAQMLVRKLEYRIVHETEQPTHQRLAIPDHTELRLGTLNAMIKAAAKHEHIEKSEVIGLL